MNDSFLLNCTIKLCCSDHISGFISAKPVIDSRENLTQKRIAFTYNFVCNLKDKLENTYKVDGADKIKYCFEKAIDLTCSDISCGVIAVEPILYDRDQKICESIECYYLMIQKAINELSISIAEESTFGINDKNGSSSNAAAEYKSVIIPVYKKMKRAKIKKGKR